MRHSLRVTWTLTLCTALALLGDATLYAVLPSNYDVIGLALWQVGWMLSVNRLIRIPLNIPSGWLSDRIGPRGPFILGVTIGALSTLGYSLGASFWFLLLMRALWGLAWSLLVVASYGMVLDVSAPEERGRLTGLYAGGSFFGGAVGAMLGGFMIDALGFAQGMRILGVLTVIGALGALTLPRHGRQGSLSEAMASTRGAFRTRWRAVVASVAELRHLDARLWLILALNFAHRFFFAGIFYGTLGLVLREMLGETPGFLQGSRLGTVVGVASLTGVLFFLRNLITVLVGPALGHLSDRLGDRAVVLMLGEATGALALLALGALLLALGGRAVDPSASGAAMVVMLASVALSATAYGIVPPMLISWIGDLTQAGERGRLVGGYQTMGDLGSGLGPLVAYGILAEGGPGLLYVAAGGLLALSIPLILRARRATR